MPKLRNGSSDVDTLTQWFGRKCRNHNPLAELELAGDVRAKKGSTYKEREATNLHVLADDPGVLLYGSAGRMFEISIKEIEPDTHKERQLQAVGY